MPMQDEYVASFTLLLLCNIIKTVNSELESDSNKRHLQSIKTSFVLHFSIKYYAQGTL